MLEPSPPYINMVGLLDTVSIRRVFPLCIGMHVISMTIKEAMPIWVNDPFLIWNLGKFWLPHTWVEVLQDTPVFVLSNATTATLQWALTLHGRRDTLVTLVNLVLFPRGCQISWHQYLPPLEHKPVPSMVSILFL